MGINGLLIGLCSYETEYYVNSIYVSLYIDG